MKYGVPAAVHGVNLAGFVGGVSAAQEYVKKGDYVNAGLAIVSGSAGLGHTVKSAGLGGKGKVNGVENKVKGGGGKNNLLSGVEESKGGFERVKDKEKGTVYNGVGNKKKISGVKSKPRHLKDKANKSTVIKETTPANRLTDAQLAETTTMPTRVGKEDHHVSFRHHGERIQFQVCSAACGTIKQKMQDVIKDSRTTPELRTQLKSLQQRVTTVEQGIENASISHGDVIRESGKIANEFRVIGEKNPHVGEALNKPQIFEDTYESRIEGDSGNHDRIRVNNLDVNGKRLEVEPRQIVDISQYDSLRISEDADILYSSRQGA